MSMHDLLTSAIWRRQEVLRARAHAQELEARFFDDDDDDGEDESDHPQMTLALLAAWLREDER